MSDTNYASFLVRVWRPSHDDHTNGWRGEIEHIQSGASRTFATLDDALKYLHDAINPLC